MWFIALHPQLLGLTQLVGPIISISLLLTIFCTCDSSKINVVLIILIMIGTCRWLKLKLGALKKLRIMARCAIRIILALKSYGVRWVALGSQEVFKRCESGGRRQLNGWGQVQLAWRCEHVTYFSSWLICSMIGSLLLLWLLIIIWVCRFSQILIEERLVLISFILRTHGKKILIFNCSLVELLLSLCNGAHRGQLVDLLLRGAGRRVLHNWVDAGLRDGSRAVDLIWRIFELFKILIKHFSQNVLIEELRLFSILAIIMNLILLSNCCWTNSRVWF